LPKSSDVERRRFQENPPLLEIIGLSFLSLVAGYVVGLFAGMALINGFSSNRHDKSVEAATTSALIIGPASALLASIATLVYLLARN
jgi:hypothetical protein